MTSHDVLHPVIRGVHAVGACRRVVGRDVEVLLLERALLLVGLRTPPRVALRVRVLAPALLDLLLVLRVIESIECLLGHDRISSLQCIDGELHGCRLPRQPLLLASQPAKVVAQRGRLVGLPLEHRADVRQPETELAQQQDALQPHERTLVVVAVSVAADAARLQQTDVVVVSQRAAGRSDQTRQLLDRQLDELVDRAVGIRFVPHDNDARG